MTVLVKTAVKDGKYTFACEFCQQDIPYHVVRHVACLDKESTKAIEMRVGANFIRSKEREEIHFCPKCEMPIFWEGSDKHVKCPGCKHNFCWRCNRPWRGQAGGSDCKNPRCQSDGPKFAKLLSCPMKTIYGRECPSLRACPGCGAIIEHIDACMQMDCMWCKFKFCVICLRKTAECPYSRNPNCTLAPRQVTISSQ